MANDNITVQVAYATPTAYAIISVSLPRGSAVFDAIHSSQLLNQFPEINLRVYRVGIFSKHVQLQDPLSEGDRVEIYRPLLVDPKEIRRRKAKKRKLRDAEPVKTKPC